MSSELAAYYVSVVPSLKGAAREVQQQMGGVGEQIGREVSQSVGRSMNFEAVGGKLQTLGGHMTDVGSTLTKGITLPAVGATLAAGGLVAAFGWGRLKSVDSAQGQLRGLGYATEDVDRITQTLVGALEGGMLTMGQATSAAAGGLAAGVEEGKELTRYIQLLDAATAGSNGTFEEMNMIFARIQGAGKMMTGELSMIEQRMPGFSAAVAEHMGVSQGELAGLVTAGKVTSEDFLDVMEAFGGEMATEYAKTWEGMVQNTQAYIGILGEALLGGVFEQSKEAIAEFIEFLASDDVAKWAAETGEAIGNAFSDILGHVREAIDWWVELDSETQKLYATFAGMAVAAGPVLVVLGKIVGIVGGALSAVGRLTGPIGFGGLMKTLGRFLGPIGLAGAALVTMWEHSDGFREAVVQLKDRMVEAGQDMQAKFEPVMEKIGELFRAIIDPNGPIMGLVNLILDVLEPVFIGMVESAGRHFDALIEVIDGALMIIEGALDFWIGVLEGDWERAWEGIQLGAEGVWSIIVANWDLFLGNVQGILETAGETLKLIWDGIWSSLGEKVSEWWTGTEEALSPFTEWFSEHIGPILQEFQTQFEAVMDGVEVSADALREFFEPWFSEMDEGFSGLINGWKEKWDGDGQGTLSEIEEAWSNLLDTLKTLWDENKVYFQGFWDQLKSDAELGSGLLRGAMDSGNSLMKGDWRSSWDTMKETVSEAWGNISGTTDRQTGRLNEIFARSGSTRVGQWTSHWLTMRSTAATMLAGMLVTVSTRTGEMTSSIATGVSRMGWLFDGGWASIAVKLAAAWNGFKLTVATNLAQMVSEIGTFPGRAVAALGNIGSTLYESGRSLISGFGQGIWDAFEAADGPVGIVARGLTRLRGLFPFSPAKDGPFSGKGYTLYSGQALMGDFGKGITDSASAAIGAARGVTEQVAAEMASQVTIPDYLPSSWSAGSIPAVASVPSRAYVPAVSNTQERSPMNPAGYSGADLRDAIEGSTIQLAIGSEKVLAKLVRVGEGKLSRL